MSKVYSGVLDQIYQAFFNKYKQAHPDKPGITVTAEVVKIWKEKLNCGKDEELYKSEKVALEEKVQKIQKANRYRLQHATMHYKTDYLQETSKIMMDEITF